VHNPVDTTPDPERHELPSPGLFRRIATLIYDGILLVCLEIVLALPLPAIPEAVRSSFGGRMAIFLGMLLVAYAFVGYCWTHGGQTLGERAWRVRVTAVNGEPMTWRLSLMRLLTGTVSLLAAGLGYLWVIVDRDSHAWHDRISGSRCEHYGKHSTPKTPAEASQSTQP